MPFLALLPAIAAVGASGAAATGAISAGTAAAVGIGAGSLLGAAGAIQQGNYAAQAANENAALMERQANQTIGISKARAGAEAVQASREISSARGAYGASGVETSGGSPLAVLHENIRQAQLNSIYTRQQGGMEASQLREQADITRQQGQQRKEAGMFEAGTGLLQGVAQGSLLSR